LPQISSDLQLRQYGLKIIPADPLVVALQPDGTYLTIWRDVDRTVEEISRFSQRDAARYPAFLELMGKISGLVGGLMQLTPPRLPNPRPGELKELLKLLGPARKLSRKDIHNTLRILPMSVADLLDEWFESEALRGLLAAQAVAGITWGPAAAGTAYTLLYHTAISGGHPFGAAGTVKGGMGALTGALAQAALYYGAEIVAGAEVERIAIEGGRACGVIMADGRQFSAAAVISNADPRTTYLKLLGPDYLDPFFVRQVNNIKFRGSGALVHLALSELPHFTALNGGQPADLLTGHLKIAPGINYLEKAYDAAKYGGFAARPALDVTIPSLADPGLAPAGRHVMSIYAQYAAYHLRQSNWNEQREALGQAVIDTLAHYAPNLKNVILRAEVITPLDLETIYGLPEGNPHHGEITLDQFLYMRPIPGWANYRAPVEGLYLCGAGTHPGGGVTGIPGKNAAREILKDWGE
jgi:phytoene dehydrogenase-like protein